MGKKNFIFRYILVTITMWLIIIILLTPCIFHPLDWKHDAWDYGWKEATEYFPDSTEKALYNTHHFNF